MKTPFLFLLFLLSFSISAFAQEQIVAPPAVTDTENAPMFDMNVEIGETAKVVVSLVVMLLGLMLFGGLFKNGTLAITGVLLVSIIFTLIGWLPMWVSFVLCLVLIVLVVWNKA
jgi:hypothetical protein